MSEQPAETTTDPASTDAGPDHHHAGLEAKVDQILGIISGGGEQEKPSTEGSNDGGRGIIGEEIRAALAERDAANAAKPKEEPAQPAAELKEKNPEPLPRRVEKLMGWR